MDQRKTVLLADAGEEFRTLLWEEMEKTGEFSVEIARDGNEILKRVKERMPDLLVMDVMLPGMDGISVLRQLQKQGDAPMTILVSGFVSDRMLAEASELGAAYFLPKPFETAALLDKMQAAGQPWAVSSLAQAAGLAALDETAYVARVQVLIAQQRPILRDGLRALGLRVLDGSANYLLFQAPETLGDALRQRGVVLRSCGNYPGLDGSWYRTAVRTAPENQQLLKTLQEVLA